MLDKAINHLLPQSGDLLWVLDETDAAPSELILKEARRSTILTNRYDIAERYRGLGLSTELSDFLFPTGSQWSAIIFPISKEKLLCKHVIYQSALSLNENGRFILYGKKNQGIKSLFAAIQGSEALKKIGEDYIGACHQLNLFEAKENFSSNYTEVSNIAKIAQFTVSSKPGIFSWKKLDQGSIFLANYLTEQKIHFNGKTVLDLACGCGHLALVSATLGAEHLHGTDNNVTAIEICRKNFMNNTLNADASCDDAGSKLTARFDIVVCNPPFHIGKQSDYSLTSKFIEAAARCLKSGGEAWFVFNAFIPAERLAKSSFPMANQVANNKQFKVLYFKKA